LNYDLKSFFSLTLSRKPEPPAKSFGSGSATLATSIPALSHSSRLSYMRPQVSRAELSGCLFAACGCGWARSGKRCPASRPTWPRRTPAWPGTPPGTAPHGSFYTSSLLTVYSDPPTRRTTPPPPTPSYWKNVLYPCGYKAPLIAQKTTRPVFLAQRAQMTQRPAAPAAATLPTRAAAGVARTPGRALYNVHLKLVFYIK
jgi:hypothetical protein